MTGANLSGVTSPLCRAGMTTEDTTSHLIIKCESVVNYEVKYLESLSLSHVKALLDVLRYLGWQK